MESGHKPDEKVILSSAENGKTTSNDHNTTLDDNAALDVERERVRRPHKKSRKGCLPCKKRHIRCDERVPICTSCLLRGLECDYKVKRERSVSLTRLLSATPSDPFDCMPIEMQGRSSETYSELLSHQNTIMSILRRDQTPPSAGFSITQVDLTFANPVWLRLAMILNLTTRVYMSQSTQVLPPDYEQTLIHHRLGVIESLKRDVMNNAVSYSTLSLMSGLAVGEFTIGEHPQMFIHMRGLFGILEQTQGASTQYSPMVKRLVISYQAFAIALRSTIRGEAGSGISESLCNHASHHDVFKNRLVLCFYQQIINMHQAELAFTGQLHSNKRNEGNLLKWLYRRLTKAQDCESGPGQSQLQGNQGSQYGNGSSSDPHKSALDVAIMAYAVMIGSFDMPRKSSTSNLDCRDPLEKLRHGMKQVVEQWDMQKGLMSEMLARKFISLMMWLETEQGVKALRYLIGCEDGEEVVYEGSSRDGIAV